MFVANKNKELNKGYSAHFFLQLENALTDESMNNVCTKHANEIEQVGYIIPKYRVKGTSLQ